LAVEGPGNLMTEPERWLADPVLRERLLVVIRQVEAEPSILGAGGHFVAVGRRG
jgi:hypothetical protein